MTEQRHLELDPEEYPDEPESYVGGDGGQDDVLHFDAPADSARLRSVIRFTIGDDDTVLMSRRPKQALLVKLAKLSGSKDPLVVASLVDEFLDAAMLPDSADYLRDRFEDPDDDWDYDVLVPTIEALKGRWFPGTPPGRQTASGPTQRRSGRRSTARSR